MASATMSFSELYPELFSVISAHLPLIYRPSTLLSLALTCHRLHEIVIPHLLYNDMRLVGEDQALSTMTMLSAKAISVDEEDIQTKGNPSPSHCIHRLCIDSSISMPTNKNHNSFFVLEELIDLGGLPHLSDLTLHIKLELEMTGKWSPSDFVEDGIEIDNRDVKEIFFPLELSFFTILRTKCPDLKSIHFTDFSQVMRDEWIESGIFSNESLTSIRLKAILPMLDYQEPIINLSMLPPNLHTLDLKINPLHPSLDINTNTSGPGGLLNCVIPNLHTLILDKFTVSDPTSTNNFWKLHPGIKRLEFHSRMTGNWFDNFEVGMLPNLQYLQCNIDHALVLLPHVSKTLIRLTVFDTYNAQAPYLLRVVAPGGILPALRSLGIHRYSGNCQQPRAGHRWWEDNHGNVSQMDAMEPARAFDGNYILSISKAAPNLEELELMGTSNETIDFITTSLSLLPKLHRLTLSGPVNCSNQPFFARSEGWTEYLDPDVELDLSSSLDEKNYGLYAPESFDDAVRDLADGCRTLDVITMGNMIGEFLIQDGGLSARIVRESEGGPVKQIRRIRAWGNIIGKEDEW